MKKEIRIGLFFAVFGLLCKAAVSPSEKPFVIEGARVLDGRGLIRANWRVVIAQGKIMEAGPQVPVPAGSLHIDGRDKWLTPGLIDVFICPTALSKETPEKSNYFAPREKIIDVLDPAKYQSRSPRTWEIMKIHREVFTRALTAGVTTLLVIPDRTKIVSGFAGVTKNLPFFRVDAVVSDSWALRIGFERKGLEGLKSRMGIASEIRAILSADPPAVPVLFDIQGEEELALALSLQEEFGLRAVLYGRPNTPAAVPGIAKRGIPVLLESPSPSDSDAFIRHWKALLDSGVETAIYSTGNQLDPLRALTALKPWIQAVGIPESRAYGFAFFDLARILGLSRRLGAIEKGMDADLVLWDGDPFQPLSKPVKVFIGGAVVYESGGKIRAGE